MRAAVSRFLVVLCVPALFAGCYTYSTIDLASATPGMAVRARVSAATAAQFGPTLGLSNGRLLSGPVVHAESAGVTIRVPTVPAGTIGAHEGLFQELLINRGDLLELESRQLDRTRTGMMIGAAVAGAVVMTVTLLHGRSSGDNAVTEPPSNFNISPLKVRSGHVVRIQVAPRIPWWQ